MKISVVTTSIRPEGIGLVAKALKRQTFQDFEWIIMMGPKPHSNAPKVVEPFKDRLILAYDPPKKEGDVWTLNKAYNKAIKLAKGELVISWQDYTYTKPDTLERFWAHYQNDPTAIVGAVGNKYSDETWTVQTWQDPRENNNNGSFYEVYPSDVEWNLCSVPKQALYDVGGFDEELDKFYGMDGYSVNIRIDLLKKYKFYLDQSIKTYSLEHGRVPDWEEKNAIHGPYQERAKTYVENPKLPYLK